MNHTKINVAGQPRTRGAARLRTAAISLAALVMLGTAANADMYQPSGTTAGGVPAHKTAPIQMAVTPPTGRIHGMAWGVEHRFGWLTIREPIPTIVSRGGAIAWSTRPTIPSNNWFFVLAQTNYYVGSGACSGCHGDKFPRGRGLCMLPLKAQSPMERPEPMPVYHTVGDGQPTDIRIAQPLRFGQCRLRKLPRPRRLA